MSVKILGFVVTDPNEDTNDVRVEIDNDTYEYIDLTQDDDYVRLTRKHAYDVAQTIIKLISETA